MRDTRNRYNDATVYSFYSQAWVKCRLVWPEDRPDREYNICIYGHAMNHRDFSMTLEDCHVRDDEGRPMYRKRGSRSHQSSAGEQVPSPGFALSFDFTWMVTASSRKAEWTTRSMPVSVFIGADSKPCRSSCYWTSSSPHFPI